MRVNEVRVTEKHADEFVLVGQEAIGIAAEALLENPEYEDQPQAHSGTPLPVVAAGKQASLHQVFQPCPKLLV